MKNRIDKYNSYLRMEKKMSPKQDGLRSNHREDHFLFPRLLPYLFSRQGDCRMYFLQSVLLFFFLWISPIHISGYPVRC